MPYHFVRDPLSQQDADVLASACKSAQQERIICPLLDRGLRVSELYGLTIEREFSGSSIAPESMAKAGRSANSRRHALCRCPLVFEPCSNRTSPWATSSQLVRGRFRRRHANCQLSETVRRNHSARAPALFHDTFSTKRRPVAAVNEILGHDRLKTNETYLSVIDMHLIEGYESKW